MGASESPYLQATCTETWSRLAVDLEFPGVPVFYSWPSQGELTSAKYHMDRENARLTVARLEMFLTELADHSNADTIHLVAHSMGADALTQALGRLALHRPDRLPTARRAVRRNPASMAQVVAGQSGSTREEERPAVLSVKTSCSSSLANRAN